MMARTFAVLFSLLGIVYGGPSGPTSCNGLGISRSGPHSGPPGGPGGSVGAPGGPTGYLCPDGSPPRPPYCECDPSPCNLRCRTGYELDQRNCVCRCVPRTCESGMQFDHSQCSCVPRPCTRQCGPNERLDRTNCRCEPAVIHPPKSCDEILRGPQGSPGAGQSGPPSGFICPNGRPPLPPYCECEPSCNKRCQSGYVLDERICQCNCVPKACDSGMQFDRTQCRCVPRPCNLQCGPYLRVDPASCQCVSEDIYCPAHILRRRCIYRWQRDPDTCRCTMCNLAQSDCPLGTLFDDSRCLCVPGPIPCSGIVCPQTQIIDRDTCQCLPIIPPADPECSIVCPATHVLDPFSCRCVTGVHPFHPDCWKPCGPGQVKNPDTCECQCSVESCSNGKVRNPDTCQCECPTSPCGRPGMVKDPDTCECSCDRAPCAPGMFRNPISCACGVAQPCNIPREACKPGYLDPEICRCVRGSYPHQPPPQGPL